MIATVVESTGIAERPECSPGTTLDTRDEATNGPFADGLRVIEILVLFRSAGPLDQQLRFPPRHSDPQAASTAPIRSA